MSFNTAAIILPLLACVFCILPTFGSFAPQEIPGFTSDKCQEEALDISEVLASVAEMLPSNNNPTPSSHPLSCLEVKQSSPGSPSGYYTLSDGTGNTNIVYCNMDELYSCPSLEQILKQVMFQQESLSQGQQLLLSGQEAMNKTSLSTNCTLGEIQSLADEIAASQKTSLYFANKTDQEVSQVHILAYQTSILQEAIRNDTLSLVGHVAEIKSVSEQTAGEISTMTQTLDQITDTLASISGKIASLDSLVGDMATQQATAMQLLSGISTTTSSTGDLLEAVQQQVQHIASKQQSVSQTISVISTAADTTSSDVSQVKMLMSTLSHNQDTILDGIDSLASTCNSGATSITLNTVSFTCSALVVLAVTLFVMVTTD